MTTAAPQVIRPSANGRRPSDEDRESFRRLAEAFATLFELKDYLPELFVTALVDHYAGIVHEVELDTPDVIRATFPLLAELGCLAFEDEPDEEGGGRNEGEE